MIRPLKPLHERMTPGQLRRRERHIEARKNRTERFYPAEYLYKYKAIALKPTYNIASSIDDGLIALASFFSLKKLFGGRKYEQDPSLRKSFKQARKGR